MSKKLIWLDCDTGHDDAMAILLAGHNPQVELLGISCVNGNCDVERATNNTLKMTSISGMQHIKVYKGAAAPLLKSKLNCPIIHGESGLDGHDFPDPTYEHEKGPALLHLYNAIMNASQKVHICATGAMTNIALLVKGFPDCLDKIEQIVVMGGQYTQGNITPSAEFNIYIDPEAFHIILNCGVKVVIIPLEVTHTVLCDDDKFRKIKDLNTPFSQAIYGIMEFFASVYKSVEEFEYPPIHDPTTIAYVINPDLFDGNYHKVDVECGSKFSNGRLILDHKVLFETKPDKNMPNAFCTKKINVNGFWDLMLDSIYTANQKSYLNK